MTPLAIRLALPASIRDVASPRAHVSSDQHATEARLPSGAVEHWTARCVVCDQPYLRPPRLTRGVPPIIPGTCSPTCAAELEGRSALV